MGLEKNLQLLGFRLRSKSDFGGTLSFDGSDYPICIGALEDSRRFGVGGFAPGKDMIITVWKDDLVSGTTFKSGQDVTVLANNGTAYALSIDSLTDGLYFWTLALNDRAQGV